MKRHFAIPAILVAFSTPLMAQDAAPAEGADESYEETVVQCIYEAKPELLYAMRDADGPDGFMEAFREGATLCEASVEYEYSMKLFFDAVNERIGPPTYEEEE